MYNHPSIKRNLDILRKDGNIVIEPATGELASGLHGKGRMEEPEIIVKKINEILGQKKKTNPRKRKPAKK
jgi:phosphopantothenoylcysteine decarboxylase/phosphopantothenate--cysteine ligase